MKDKQQSIEEDEIDLGKLFQTLKRRIFTIIFITLLITTATFIYSYFLPPIYSSSVKISFSNEKKSSMSALIPNSLSDLTKTTEKRLETVKLTLETIDFINMAINNLNLSQRYFIEHNYRKDEIYQFENLDVFLDIHDDALQEKDETLYNKFFKITPIDKKQFVLTVDLLDYNQTHDFGELIKSDYFSMKVTKKSALADTNYYIKKENPELLADNILKNLTTTILSDDVLEISYQNSVPRRAKEVVAQIAKEFRELTLTKKTSELKKRLDFINSQIGIIETQLKGEGKNLKDYQKKNQTFFTLENKNRIILKQLSEKKELIKKLKLQLQALNSFQQALKRDELNTVSLLNSGIELSSIKSLIELFQTTNIELEEMKLQAKNTEKALTQRPQLERLIQELQEEKIKLKELNFNFTYNHPEVVQANSNIADIKEAIDAYIKTDIKRLNQSKYSIKKKILSNIITTKKNIKNKISFLKKDITKSDALMQTIPEKSLTVQELKRKFLVSENIYTFLLQKKMETEMSLASIIENTKIIENAREALKPIKPNKKLIVVVGFITGLILAIFYVLFKAMLDTKIRTEEDIKELTNIPLYGSLPNKKNKRFFDEAIRNIRTNLQFILPKNKKCINILISSTIAGEGKTTTIAYLAEVISQTKKRVLIMDLDLRKPRLYQELKQSNKLGMTQYLTADLELNESIQKVTEYLDFFPAGAVQPNPSELLMSEKFKETIQMLSKEYDYILFDTPPIGSVIDAKVLVPYADIVLLVVRANLAEKGFIEYFQRIKEETDIESAGIILNDVKHDKSQSYGYGYGV